MNKNTLILSGVRSVDPMGLFSHWADRITINRLNSKKWAQRESLYISLCSIICKTDRLIKRQFGTEQYSTTRQRVQLSQPNTIHYTQYTVHSTLYTVHRVLERKYKFYSYSHSYSDGQTEYVPQTSSEVTRKRSRNRITQDHGFAVPQAIVSQQRIDQLFKLALITFFIIINALYVKLRVWNALFTSLLHYIAL